MKSSLFIFVFLFCAITISAQKIKFVSKNTGNSLSQVHVFNEEGKLIVISDIEGQIELDDLSKNEKQFSLVHENYRIGTLTQEDLQKKEILLNDRIVEIEEVIVTKNSKSKYIYVKGFFNSYLNLNKNLNVYADGLITYVYDSQSKKLKSTRLEQYRVFLKENKAKDSKNVSEMVFDSMLTLPDVKLAGVMGNEEESNYKEVITGDQIKRQAARSVLQEREIKFLGYRMFDLSVSGTYNYNEKVQLNQFNSYNQKLSVKVKHKSEPDYNLLEYYTNFVVTEIGHGDSDSFPKVKLRKDRSYYNHDYWKMKRFPDMLKVFKEYHKDTLKEMPNGIKK